jgi:hypothetical protein
MTTLEQDTYSGRRDILTWLAREDVSLYGECHGPILNLLVAAGYVSLDEVPPTARTGVRVTEAGFDWLARETGKSA